MSPEEWRHDAKEQMLRTWAQMEHETQRLEQLAAAHRRAHRCWPSRFWCGVAGLALAYAIVQQVTHRTWHTQHEDTLQRAYSDMKAWQGLVKVLQTHVEQMASQEGRLAAMERALTPAQTKPQHKK